MFNKRTINVAAILIVALSAAQIAQADFMHYNGLGLKKTVDVQAKYSLLGRDFSTSAGQMKVEYKGVDYLGYCVDAFQSAASTSVTAQPYTILRNANQIAYVFEMNAHQVTTGEQTAGLQTVIWELLYEKNTAIDFNLDSGNFRIKNSNVIDDANSMLDDMRANMPADYEPTMELLVLKSACKQDILIGRDAPPIPEPATATLLAIGSPLALKRRRGAA